MGDMPVELGVFDACAEDVSVKDGCIPVGVSVDAGKVDMVTLGQWCSKLLVVPERACLSSSFYNIQ